MSKYTKLIEWMSLADAAKQLTIILDDEITEAKVLQLALEGHLRLSVRFFNKVSAKAGKIVPIENIEYKDVPSPYGNGEFVRTFKGLTIRSDGIPTHVIKLVDAVIYIDGIFDLLMVCAEKLDIANRYQKLSGESLITTTYHDGSFVKDLNGCVYQLQQYIKHKPTLENPMLEDEFLPATSLPQDGPLVVRTEALFEFEKLVNGRPKLNKRSYISDNLIILNQAAELFWKNADPHDRTTQDTNGVVTEWLIKNGMSKSVAEKGATIIRPEWASLGRRPDV